ncbi:dipeptidase PepV [Thalassorhabdus alkalitolerans]|uniref:Dipeptidase PepV n=1 Tax=Thalassorhabdus alkalitolerans TaxID=2282697 RepID=A0ABW0YK77_9BACI
MTINWMDEVLQRKEKILSETSEFLSIPSILDETTAAPNAPFGKKVAEALEYILEKGTKDGFSTKNVEGYAGHIHYGSYKETVGVLCHVDVVPPGDGWTNDPFSPVIKDGKLIARGAIDDKGPTMAAYFALQLIKDLELPLSKNIRLIIGADEESEWRCVKRYFEEEPVPDTGFAPDAEFPVIFAEKGICDFFFKGAGSKSKDGKADFHLDKFNAGHRLNMVPEKAEAHITAESEQKASDMAERFESFLKKEEVTGRKERSGDTLVLTLEGKAAHGSLPQQGINAGVLMAQFLNKVPMDKRGGSFVELISTHFSDFVGEKAGIEIEDEVSGHLTINPGLVRYNEETDELGVNIRYPVKASYETIKAQLEHIAQKFEMKIDVAAHKGPHFVDPEDPLVQTLQKVYEKYTEDKSSPIAIGGGTYARAMTSGVAFGPLFPGREEVAHQRDEHIFVEDLLKCTAIYAEALYELSKK